jgi:hypothetical protein
MAAWRGAALALEAHMLAIFAPERVSPEIMVTGGFRERPNARLRSVAWDEF